MSQGQGQERIVKDNELDLPSLANTGGLHYGFGKNWVEITDMNKWRR